MFDCNLLNNDFKEPNIVKAQFIVSPTRIYNLEFDQNITMYELKLMIQNAAHLRSNNFSLICNGVEYNKYNQETFESLFHEQKLVIFHLEIKLADVSDQTELLLQMNCPCDIHIDKFLLYYCFTCKKSVCSDCFINGVHKGHEIQDKCFYLLPSKILVDKLFENWSQNPYEEYKYSEDQTLAELRLNLNKMIFDKISELLKNIQNKVANVIEQYHYTNYQSFDSIRNSIRDIKVYCIKILDDLKEKMKVKDIINNEQIFLDFDKAYKKLGKLQNSKFATNSITYQEFTQQIPCLIKNLINDINNKLLLTLNQLANDQRYDNILNQIQMKSIKSFTQEEINKEINIYIKKNYDDFTKKRLTINYGFCDYDNKNKEKNEKKSINEEKKGRKTLGPNEMSSIHLENIYQNNNVFSSGNNNFNNMENGFNKKNKDIPNLFNNNAAMAMPSINYNNNNIGKIINSTTTTEIEKKYIGIPSKNITTGNIQSNLTIYPYLKSHRIKENKNSDIYSSANIPRKNLEMNLFSNATNKPTFNLETQSNKDKINNNTLTDSFSSNSTINNINQIAEENLKNNEYIICLNDQNECNTINNNEISNKTISSYTNNSDNLNIINQINNTQNKKNLFYTFGIRSIPEEATESENEAYSLKAINRLINKTFILAPISQTNFIKLITDKKKEEMTIPLKFPPKLDFNSFLLECAYCNCYSLLYITGGLSNGVKTNVSLLVDISEKDDKISVLSPMNCKRFCHTMISYGEYLFAVGGKNESSVERYTIFDNIWENLMPMNYKRMYPILAIHNEYLYAFFGKTNENEYCNSIERLRLCKEIKQTKWEMVQFSNPEKIDTRIYGSAVRIIDNYLYIFGGKINEETTNKIFNYNLDKNILRKENSSLEDCVSFRENKLFQINNESSIQIVDNSYEGIYIKINTS